MDGGASTTPRRRPYPSAVVGCAGPRGTRVPSRGGHDASTGSGNDGPADHRASHDCAPHNRGSGINSTCNDGLNRRRNRDRQRDDRHGCTQHERCRHGCTQHERCRHGCTQHERCRHGCTQHERCRHGSNRGTVGGTATVRVFGELPRHQHQTCRPVSRRLSVLPLDMGLGGAPDRS